VLRHVVCVVTLLLSRGWLDCGQAGTSRSTATRLQSVKVDPPCVPELVCYSMVCFMVTSRNVLQLMLSRA
jgi:hypothetical protein